eukprot:3938824-Amphidinium_carterae.1
MIHPKGAGKSKGKGKGKIGKGKSVTNQISSGDERIKISISQVRRPVKCVQSCSQRVMHSQ